MLALSNKLLKDFETIFIKKELINIDDKMQKFIKYLHLPVLISTHQDNKYKNPQIAKQGGSLFKIVNKNDDSELVKATNLKIMLDLDSNNSNFIKVDILNDKLSPKYSATYYKNENRDKAIEHIKAFLENATTIFIYDKYILNRWEKSKNLFIDLIPKKSINIFYAENHLKNKTSEIKTICNNWNIKEDKANSTHRNLHDRYIIIDSKIELILTSGIDNLFNDTSDFTYIINEI